jgi:hypothetical protein
MTARIHDAGMLSRCDASATMTAIGSAVVATLCC